MDTMTDKERAEECLRLFRAASRSYREHDSNRLILTKVWNRGMGRLSAIRIYPDERTILVNNALWTRLDENTLQDILSDLNMTEWKRAARHYGYPTYYSHSFGLHLAV